ncbi:MAG TPA: LysM peptidoglycan-binding domain-containing protein [Anaerolineales bacterium]|nr:LysM peptidoglycan-binding domain-containing protein [Anaerolineales bacterium]
MKERILWRTFYLRHPSAFVVRLAILLSFIVSSCAPRGSTSVIENMITPLAPTPIPAPTSGRPEYKPGELVEYTAQNGDTLPALAARFNTTVAEILEANPIIPRDATTMPPGLPMQIPIYYLPLWGTAYQSIPDHAFVNGPAQIGFNTSAYLASTNGWWKDYRAYAGGKTRTGAEIVDYVATNYSISPRLLLAILEYQAGALTQPHPPQTKYLLGFHRAYYESPYLQLILAANTLNNGYYGWRRGSLTEFELLDRSLFRPDPWQNAGSVAIQYYFSRIYAGEKFFASIGPEGFARVYRDLFGDPWLDSVPILPGSLQQPELRFPFPPGTVWAFTSGPHTGWGMGEPFAALDFAPAMDVSGCFPVPKDLFATAMADGLVVRSSVDGLVLDLDKDGDERTGWALFYLHLASEGRAPVGAELKAGDPIGYPSCEGGSSTGTHVHVARKYNGEWILADGTLAFNLEGWIAYGESQARQGTLRRGAAIIIACECSDASSQIISEMP